MRKGIKKSYSILLTITFLLTMFSFTEVAGAASFLHQNSNRVELNFNTNWLYMNYDMGDGSQVAIDEAGFQQVSLPHSNKILPHKSFNPNDTRFVSWYRRHFKLPAAYNGRKVSVDFQGVTTVAQVYVNGNYVGEHKGAYTAFSVDITSFLNPADTDNVIAIRVDSTKRSDVPPEGGDIDYLLFGGITRDVKMVVADKLRVDSVFATTPTVSSTNAVVNAKTVVKNDNTVQKSCTVITNVVDASGNVVATATATANIAANSSYEFNHSTSNIASPNLWHPDNPYLYTLYTQVKDGTTFVDEYKTRIGIRSIEFRKSDGKFYINGQSLKLIGLNRHEMYPFIGRSAPNRLQRKDAEILKYDLGLNAMRSSHYPPDPEFLDRCDEIGLLVLEEIPGWQYVGDTNWQNIAIKNVEEMIVRDRNHPSIVTWGVRINESGDNSTFYTQTNNKARALDPTRPTSGVRNFTSSQFLEDLYTFNDFSGTIQAPVQQPWLVTEYLGHTFPTKSFDAESRLVNHMLKHASIQNDSMGRTNVSGALGWCAFDYNTLSSPYGPFGENMICYHGVSDIYRISKPAAYFYKAQTNPTKYGAMVYIASYWKGDSSTTVNVLSNCEQVELFVNGVSKGKITPNTYTNLTHPIFRFSNVTYEVGQIKAIGYINGTATATYTWNTPGSVAKIMLTPDSTQLTADGSDMTRVVVTAVDSNNQVVPLAANSVSFSVTGAGTFIGENSLILEDGKGAFFVRSKLSQTGSISCVATSSGLQSGSAVINAVAMTEQIVPVSQGAVILPKVNVALNKTAIADSEETAKGNTAAKGNDGSYTTRWCTADGNSGHWWKVDLGGAYNLIGTEVNWEKSGIPYKYKVEVSADNTSWTMAADMTQNTSTVQTQTNNFTANAVRYVRITNTGGLQSGVWCSFFEFKVFGNQAQIPATPAGLTAAGSSTSQINVSWVASAGAAGYDLEVDGIIVSNVTNPYAHTRLAAGSSHSYRIRAKNSLGISSWSGAVSASSLQLQAPSWLTPTAVSSTEINVTWNPSAGATGYDLEADGVVIGNVTSPYRHTGLTPNSTHTYRVRAKEGTSTSPWCNAISETTLASGTDTYILIPQSQMSATATSEETSRASNSASNVLDGSRATFWHTKWDLSNVLPQSITLNLGGTYNVSQIKYLPRQDGNTNGIITGYNIYTSTDGTSFTKVIGGTWTNNAAEKTVNFNSVTASYVRLEATAGNGGWAAAGEINVYRQVAAAQYPEAQRLMALK